MKFLPHDDVTKCAVVILSLRVCSSVSLSVWHLRYELI